MRRWYSYTLVGRQAESNMSMRIKVVVLVAVVVWLQYYCMQSPDAPALAADSETRNIQAPTQGFVISMNNETGWKVSERLKEAFGITDMHVVLGHAGNESKPSLYNRYLMRYGRTDTLQNNNLGMFGCLESHRHVWSLVRQDSYVFEEDAVPVKDAMKIVKTLLMDNAHRPWSVIHLDKPFGFFSGNMFWPDRAQYTKIGRITETCRDCIAYSTRGYILTQSAAQILLQLYEPPVVQVDAYMSLLNAFDPRFKQVWTRVQVVDEALHVSSIQNYYEPVSVIHVIMNFFVPQK
jgi:GR25 family glycosyltransferase involved in LPS biosynthesis